MEISNSIFVDIDEIFSLYRTATAFQKSKLMVHWPIFDEELIKTEIIENRQWKLMIDNKIACIWAIAFDDKLIWGKRNEDPSIYIHRIATNPDFRGYNLVEKIVEWAIAYAMTTNKQFIRMDTVGENIKLIEHYKKCGFNFIGLSKLTDTNGLPAHYNNGTVSLFEIEIQSSA